MVRVLTRAVLLVSMPTFDDPQYKGVNKYWGDSLKEYFFTKINHTLSGSLLHDNGCSYL